MYLSHDITRTFSFRIDTSYAVCLLESPSGRLLWPQMHLQQWESWMSQTEWHLAMFQHTGGSRWEQGESATDRVTPC